MTEESTSTSRPSPVRVLADVGRALSSSREPREIIDLILDGLSPLLDATRTVLIVVGADQRIRMTAFRGLNTRIRELLPRSGRDGLAMAAITERRTLWSADVLNDPALDLSATSRTFIEAAGYRSAVAVPLLADIRVLGVLMAARTEVRPFSPEEIEIAEALAGLAALALEQGRQSAVEVRRLHRDETLVEVEREMLAELSAERLFPMILERAGALVGAKGSIHVAEPGRRWLRKVWSTLPECADGLSFGEGVAGICADTRRGVLVPDYPRWEKAFPDSLRLGVQSAMAQPLLSRGELLGVITMDRLEPGSPPFTPDDLATLERAARQAALALRNATLYGQAEQRRRAAQELARLSRTLSDRLDANALGAEIVQSFHSLFPELSCTLRLLRPDGTLVAIASTDFEPGHVQAPGTGLTARVLSEGHAVWSLDRLAEPGLIYDEDLRRRVEHMHLHAGLVVPLRTERGTLGVLQVSARDAREFSAHEAELAQSYADQAALTIERARLFDALEKSDARYRELFENSNDAMATVTVDRVFTSVNRAFEALLGWSRDELVGQNSDIVGTPASIAQWEDRTRRAMAGEKLRSIWETEMRHKSGRIIQIESRTRLFRDRTGRGVGVEGTYRNIAARKEMEAALLQAKDAAESASIAKSSFLASMSHELRTPLNGILGYVQVLKREGELAARHDKALGIIEQSGEHLLGLINEILDFAKIEAGSFEIQSNAFELRSMLDGIAEIMRTRAEDKQLSFLAEWFSELPSVVRTDERRLRQVLMNLLDNAVKYTHDGGVAFKVGRHGERVRFMVEDTGIGIDAQHLVSIFEPFHRVRDPQGFVEGTGLGLAISRTLVALIGGSLEVVSTPGQGSRFWFDLDLPEASRVELESAKPRRVVAGVRGDRRRLLVVDDKETNRRLLRDLLVPLGFEVTEASDGKECLARVSADRPDGILLDLRMPGMDGIEVTRRIRAAEGESRIVIVAVSASAFEHHREQCLEAGADDFAAKPFRLETLVEILCRHLGLEALYTESSRGPAREISDDDAVPPPSELADLLDLARRGSIRRIVNWASRLETESRYASFAEEVRTLAERFDLKQLRQFLEEAGARS